MQEEKLANARCFMFYKKNQYEFVIRDDKSYMINSWEEEDDKGIWDTLILLVIQV